MANYIRHLCVYGIPAAVLGAGLIHLRKPISEDNEGLYTQRFSPALAGNIAPTSTTVHRWDPNWDRRNPSDILEEKGIKDSDNNYETEYKKYKPVATRNIILIRHGQYNLKGANDEERTLTELGRLQAEYTGNRLKELNFPYDVLHRSTMTRAQETADIILGCFKDSPVEKVKDSDMLREGAPVPPEPPIKHWKPEVHQFFQDGSRLEAAFRKYFYRADINQENDSYEVIVCHANVIRYFVCRALQLPANAWLRFVVNHCSITWFSITPSGRVINYCIGDVGHMPPNLITSS